MRWLLAVALALVFTAPASAQWQDSGWGRPLPLHPTAAARSARQPLRVPSISITQFQAVGSGEDASDASPEQVTGQAEETGPATVEERVPGVEAAPQEVVAAQASESVVVAVRPPVPPNPYENLPPGAVLPARPVVPVNPYDNLPPGVTVPRPPVPHPCGPFTPAWCTPGQAYNF